MYEDSGYETSFPFILRAPPSKSIELKTGPNIFSLFKLNSWLTSPAKSWNYIFVKYCKVIHLLHQSILDPLD